MRALRAAAVVGLLFCAPAAAQDSTIAVARELAAVIGDQMLKDLLASLQPAI